MSKNVNNQHFADVFQSESLSVCVKDREHRVLYQNDSCVQLCGQIDFARCSKNCMEYYVPNNRAPEREEGTQYYPSCTIESKTYDLVFINDGRRLTSLIYPLKNKHQADVSALKQYELTPKEMEVALLMAQNTKNSEIAKKLGVSIGTVKSHINAIYKKLPDDVKASLR